MKRRFVVGTIIAVLLAPPAFAADAVIEEVAPAPVATTYDWSGPYIGVFGGLLTGDFDYEAGVIPGPVTVTNGDSDTGFLGGVQVGYDFQTGPWVFGAVADIAYTDFNANVAGAAPGVAGESELEYLGTARARAGYAFDRALIYAHGGLAYGRVQHTMTSGGVTLFEGSNNHVGWTAGAGFEYGVTDQVSLGVEYAYVDLGDEEVFSGGVIGPVFVNEDITFHTVKAMLNFRF